MIAFRLIDEVVEDYLDLVDKLNEEVEELDDHVEIGRRRTFADGSRISATTSSTFAGRSHPPATRCTRSSTTERRSRKGGRYPQDVEIAFRQHIRQGPARERGPRELRELVSSVRDYYVARSRKDQNEVVKRLTVVASLLLVPTFIVGVYGQNFLTSRR